MLTLTRKRGEETYLRLPDGRQGRIVVSGVSGGRVRLTFDLPGDVQVSRPEWQEPQSSRLLDACEQAVDLLEDYFTPEQLAEREIVLTTLHEASTGNPRRPADAALRLLRELHDAMDGADMMRRRVKKCIEHLAEVRK